MPKIISFPADECCIDLGGDPTSNPRLATLISSAKKSGFAKESIENAIARGCGKYVDGKALETVLIELMLPPSIGAIIECQTDSVARTLQDIRTVAKDNGAVMTPTKHLFERRGMIVMTPPDTLDDGALFDMAIEAGASDIDKVEGGAWVVYTNPTDLTDVSEVLSDGDRGIRIDSAELTWVAVEDTMSEDPGGKVISQLIEQLEEGHGVQEIHLNIR